MKKIRTRIIALATVLVMFFAIARVAYADVYEVPVVFTADNHYVIEIPETIVVGETSSFTVSESDIANGGCVTVKLANDESESAIYNNRDTSRPLRVFYYDEKGIRATSSTPLAVIRGDETKTFTTSIGNMEDAMAGEYTGTVMFDVDCW